MLAADDDAAVAVVERFLAARAPAAPDPLGYAVLVDAVAARVAADPGITRVDDLATGFGVGMRRLQRLFAGYVGVGPKVGDPAVPVARGSGPGGRRRRTSTGWRSPPTSATATRRTSPATSPRWWVYLRLDTPERSSSRRALSPIRWIPVLMRIP